MGINMTKINNNHDAIERAAQALALCMDYPWDHMPEQGRERMREMASKVAAPLLIEQKKELAAMCRGLDDGSEVDGYRCSWLILRS
jgi:hypothetical protein